MFSHLQARHARSAILVAVAPLLVLESDANLYIKIYLSSTFTIFNITLTFVYN